ncbi:MAG TPA: YjfB family protein [Rhodocyclaceae bacterium]|nr:YjfB family protein [Rhodocyclaceae bacterium]
MDVTSIAALATEMSAARTQQAVSMAVLKMALDQQGSAALALLDATAQSSAEVAASASASAVSDTLGQNIDTYA